MIAGPPGRSASTSSRPPDVADPPPCPARITAGQPSQERGWLARFVPTSVARFPGWGGPLALGDGAGALLLGRGLLDRVGAVTHNHVPQTCADQAAGQDAPVDTSKRGQAQILAWSATVTTADIRMCVRGCAGFDLRMGSLPGTICRPACSAHLSRTAR